MLYYGNSLNITCDICKEIVLKIDDFIAKNTTIDAIAKIAVPICEVGISGSECPPPYDSWQCVDVCNDAVQMYKDPLDELILTYLDPGIICYNIGIECPEPTPPNPEPLPNTLRDNLPRNNSGIGYFVQIPDIHLDTKVIPNSVANCGEPMCCRELDNQYNYTYNVTYAGMFGIAEAGINCDVSVPVFNSMNSYISDYIIKNVTNNSVDFIVFVGDGVPHDVYNQSQEQHLTIMKQILYSWKDTIGKNVPIFNILGNHEGQPVNQFQGPPYDNWFNQPMSQLFAEWIDNEYSRYDDKLPSEIMSYGGYYTSLIRPGIRFIGLNTGYVQGGNYWRQWSHYPNRDMGGQLKWLNDTLYQAKVLNEMVIIGQHFPMGSFDGIFQDEYYNIYQNYKDIIKLGLFGHTHTNYYNTFGYMPTNANQPNGDPWSVFYVPGSITTYGGRMPSFRLYEYHRNNLTIINYSNYIFNMSKSNKYLTPIWEKLYDFKSEYSMKNATFWAHIDLAHKLAYNDTLWNKFQLNNWNGIQHNMDRNGTVCELLSATNEQKTYCKNNIYKTDITIDEYEELYLNAH